MVDIVLQRISHIHSHLAGILKTSVSVFHAVLVLLQYDRHIGEIAVDGTQHVRGTDHGNPHIIHHRIDLGLHIISVIIPQRFHRTSAVVDPCLNPDCQVGDILCGF